MEKKPVGVQETAMMKKKNLEDVMFEYVAKCDQEERPRRQALFLAYREDISELHRKGWDYADIWRAMRNAGLFAFSESTFRRYVRRWCKGNTTESISPATAPISPEKTPELPRPPKTDFTAPPVGKVDMPIFGQNRKPRDHDRF